MDTRLTKKPRSVYALPGLLRRMSASNSTVSLRALPPTLTRTGAFALADGCAARPQLGPHAAERARARANRQHFAYVARVRDGSTVAIDRPASVGASEPRVESPDALLAAAADDGARRALERRLLNKVRKCAQCGKANGFTLQQCNACGASLRDVPIGHTNNVFTGFACGVKSGPFPFTISLRLQDPDFMVFDDLLSLTLAHLNVIPTSVFLPDWRFLLRHPQRGLALVDEMHSRCVRVLREQFLASRAWRAASFNADAAQLSDDELLRFVMAGFNFPPSQFQLHLQFMMPPLLPFQYQQYQRGVHMTYERFFPLPYVRAVLALDAPYDVRDDTPIGDIIAHYKALGVDYDVLHAEYYKRAQTSQEKLANFAPAHFDALVVDSGPDTPAAVYAFSDEAHSEAALDADADAKALPNADKMQMQNYGRPYVDGKPRGTYYAHARANPMDIREF